MKALNRKEVLVNAKANGTLDSFEPLTRDEAFTKKALGLGGGGGGSGGDMFVVTLSTDMETGKESWDKTYDDVLEAYDNEKYVVLCDYLIMNGEKKLLGYYSMATVGNGRMLFAKLSTDGTIWTAELTADGTFIRNNFFNINGAKITNADGLIMQSSTNGSEKRFRIKVYDDGILKATEI